MSDIRTGSNIYFLMVMISCLLALFISMSKRKFFKVKNLDNWLCGIIFQLLGALILLIGSYKFLIYGNHIIMFSFIISFIYYHFEYKALNNSSIDNYLFWLPIAFLIFSGFESLLLRTKESSYILFVLLFCYINIQNTLYLLIRLKNFSVILKFSGIITAILFSSAAILFYVHQKPAHFQLYYLNPKINLIFWVLLCFAQLFLTLNLLILCLDRLHLQVEQRNFEQIKIQKIISHDLNSAISAISSGLKFLSETKSNNTVLLYQLEKSANGAHNLLFNVLRWLHKENIPNEIHSETIDVKKTIDDMLQFFNYQIRDKKISVKFRNYGKLEVGTNIFIFEAIIRNLISNAIKYSHFGGIIFIDYSVNFGSFTVSVRDFGIGMTKNQVNKLNSIGLNTSTTGTNGELGNAIGLNIVRDLIKSCSGKIQFTSIQSEGTEVIIQLPNLNTN